MFRSALPSASATCATIPGRLGTVSCSWCTSSPARSASSSRRRSVAGGVVPGGQRRRRRPPAARPPPPAAARTVSSISSRQRVAVGQVDVGPDVGVRARPRAWRRGSSGPTRGSGSSSWASVRAAWATSTLASTCGRWLDRGQQAVVGGGVEGDRAGAEGAARAGAGARAAGPTSARTGVRYQAAPSNRSARAFSTPLVSAPATGWPPTKRSSAIASTTCALVEPTSLTTQSAPGRVERRLHLVGQRAHRPAGKAGLGAVERLLERPGRPVDRAALAGGLQALGAAAEADDLARPARAPPGRSSRRSARRPGRRSRTLGRAGPARRPASSSSTPSVVVPVHAGVGDRLAVDERLAGHELLGPGDEEGLEHHADDRAASRRPAAPAMSAATSGWRSGSLPLLSCEASMITRSGRPAPRSSPARRPPPRPGSWARRARRAG